MIKSRNSHLVLYYAWLPTLAILAFGVLLFRSKSVIAVAVELLISLILSIEGFALVLDFRGYGSAATQWYKREPASYLVRATPSLMLRLLSGFFFIFMSGLYLWVAVRTLG